jgi:hypothetical protein
MLVSGGNRARSTSAISRRRIAAIAIAIATFAAPAMARESRVVIGEVSSNVTRAGQDYESLLRSASEEELSALDLSLIPLKRRVIVSVALVRLDTLAAPRTTDATCEISATLRDARGGSVFAILQGKARAMSGGAPGEVESTAVHGALHGALARIPEALGH